MTAPITRLVAATVDHEAATELPFADRMQVVAITAPAAAAWAPLNVGRIGCDCALRNGRLNFDS